ncbi:MAG: cytochrome c3 family protein [Chloroflexi bacterium]|nr:cytochrome c3 family protein [Chloroflexota bacterium]
MLERFKISNLLEKGGRLIRKPSFLVGMGVLFILLFSAAGYGVWTTQQPPPQPIQFNHSIHVELGAQCLYCHPGAWRQASAGLPTTAKCWGCHQQMPNTKPEQQKLVVFVERGDPIPWAPVFIQPDFVYFNHRPHIAGEVNCETCHGEISRMTVAQPNPRQNMGWCLECHRATAGDDPDKLARLTDCVTCHR